MRTIHLARLDKIRPVLILTRSVIRPYLTRVTIAPITSTIRGLTTEIELDPHRNGVNRICVVTCDNIQTIPVSQVLGPIGQLMPDQEPALTTAIAAAFDLADLP